MKHSHSIALLVALASSASASQAFAQSAPYPGEDPAKLFGYEIDARETDSTRVAEKALRAVQRARETAEEVKMVFGANHFHIGDRDDPGRAIGRAPRDRAAGAPRRRRFGERVVREGDRSINRSGKDAATVQP